MLLNHYALIQRKWILTAKRVIVVFPAVFIAILKFRIAFVCTFYLLLFFILFVLFATVSG